MVLYDLEICQEICSAVCLESLRCERSFSVAHGAYVFRAAGVLVKALTSGVKHGCLGSPSADRWHGALKVRQVKGETGGREGSRLILQHHLDNN